MKKIKCIKIKSDGQMIVDLQNIIIQNTNSKLISIAIHMLCRKFVNDLKKTPLSDELQ